MGGLLACCISPGHCTCCAIISILGAIFYTVFFITVTLQPQFMDIKMKNQQETRWACMVAVVFYMSCFIGAIFMVMRGMKKNYQQERQRWQMREQFRQKRKEDYGNLVEEEDQNRGL